MNRTILLIILGLFVTLNSYAATVGNWTEGKLVVAADGVADDRLSFNDFGQSAVVDSDGVRMIVGAIGDDINGFTWAGGAYIFEYVDGTWTEKQKLTPPDPATAGESTAFGGYLYGGSVSIDGFFGPSHVSSIIGSRPLSFFADEV